MITRGKKRIEGMVVCFNCGSRIRGDTAKTMSYCECGAVKVRGTESSFSIGGSFEQFSIVLTDPMNYMLPESELW